MARPVYEAVRSAILDVVPADREGIAFRDLPAAVEPRLPAALFAERSVSWHVTTVKLDLEGVR